MNSDDEDVDVSISLREKIGKYKEESEKFREGNRVD